MTQGEETNAPVGAEDVGKLMTAIHWHNIHRLAEELEAALLEVKSAYWLQQSRKLRDRAMFEIDAASGKRMT